MAATPASPAAPSSTAEDCPICWDELSTNCGKTLVTLQCSHKFHLDCIGSTFNSFGEMRCPLCRATENGTWVIPRERADQAAYEDHDSDSDEDEFEFDEWDLFLPEGWTEATRALFYQAFSRPAVSATDDGTLYHQVSAFDIIRQLNYQWNQPPLPAFNSMFNHFATTTHPTRVASSTSRTSPGRSQGVGNIESFFEPVILEPGRSNGPTHCNFDWTCPPNNSPSPGVHAMMSGRSGSNGLPARVPAGNAALQSEQAQFNVPLDAPINRQHQELPLIVQPETNNLSPSENFPDNIDPSLK